MKKTRRSSPCGCMACTEVRMTKFQDEGKPVWECMTGWGLPGWRYACEICGNKRCPHHTYHGNACTGSNEPGQSGSAF